MITFVTGTVHSVTPPSVVLDVGGVGVELLATARCMSDLRPGQLATVPATLVVREESWTLFGFADFDERSCFQALQHAKGVGPKVAISLLSVLTPDQLRVAVATGDASALTAAPGVGARGAARLVIDLRDRLGPVSGQPAAATPAGPLPTGGWQRDVHAALVGLGWSSADASAGVAQAAARAAQDGSSQGDGASQTGRMLRLALLTLDRKVEVR